MDRQASRQTNERETRASRQTDRRQTDRQADRPAGSRLTTSGRFEDGHTERRGDRQTRQTDRQDRQADERADAYTRGQVDRLVHRQTYKRAVTETSE